VVTRKDPSIAYYVSAHGYGHGVRACDCIQALNRLYPEINVHIVTSLPGEFLYNRISSERNSIRSLSFDVGMVQKDSIRVDVPATLNRLEELYTCREDLICREIEFIKRNKIALVVVDIPAIPLEAANRCGIPSIAIGNFGWDWIYAEFIDGNARWESLVENIQEAYAKTDLLLRLPFSEEMRAFQRKKDLPLVASPGRSRRKEIADLVDCNLRKKWVLLSFTNLEWSDSALDRVEGIREYEFFTVYPLEWHRSNIHTIYREKVPFPDVVASVDAVVSKPGFGILSDCVVNHKPLIYADRRDFAEFNILESNIKKYLTYVHIPSKVLYEGNLRQSLQKIWTRPEASAFMPHGGDVLAAEQIVRLAGIK